MIKLRGNERILIILKGSIGDVARGIFVATAIKKKMPDVRIGWIVEPKSRDVVECLPAVDQVIIFERKKGLSGLINAIKEIRRFAPNVTLDMQRHLKSGLFSLLSGAPVRLGFNRRNSKEFNWIFQSHCTEFTPDTESKINAYRKFILSLGIESSDYTDRIDFGLKPKPLPEELNRLFLESKKRVGLILGSTWETKNWPTEGYIKLVKDLAGISGIQIFLLGDSSQASIANEITAAIKSSNLVDLTGKTKLSGAISVIEKMSLLVGPDSGPGHIAAALGVPQVTLFGPTPENRVAPYGGRDLILRAPTPCSPCLRRECPGLNNICMRLISADAVAKKAKQYLGF
jgi:lipopolysaccharide heptosyltransferase II